MSSNSEENQLLSHSWNELTREKFGEDIKSALEWTIEGNNKLMVTLMLLLNKHFFEINLFRKWLLTFQSKKQRLQKIENNNNKNNKDLNPVALIL